MCGIAGFISRSSATPDKLKSIVSQMTTSLAHRGPDDHDLWTDPEAGIALGHRRLSILDLSPLGRQPMHSTSGRFVLSYNGEVYNHLDLRRELELCGHGFRGGSDTETILAAVEEWGLTRAVARFVGMFAFALWDRQERKLYLVRDRLGIKPLYYGRAGSDFLFGSELKALRAHPDFDTSINRDAVALYFRYYQVPAPYCITNSTAKLEPGCMATLDQGTDTVTITRYWLAKQHWQDGEREPFGGNELEATNALETLLSDAVSLRMLSDVPLGAFLSGGIDSSLVTALMQSRSQRPVKSFSIGFTEERFNEAPQARAVAAHLGTDHTELTLTPQDLLDVVPRIPEYWDEPFADSSQIPTFLVCALARQSVTVCLSGDGGDELFAGYDRYRWGQTWQQLSRIPRPLRQLAGLGRKLPRSLFALLGPLGPKVHWRLEALGVNSFAEFYDFFLSHNRDTDHFVPGSQLPATDMTTPVSGLGDLHRQMTWRDLIFYLPHDILTKVDRASMAVSLEARVPLLDHRVVEFAARIPTSMKIRDGKGKWLLRQVLSRYVPPKLVERPKMGFGVPVELWMRNELRDWCESLLDEKRIREQGLLDAIEVRRMWSHYLGGQTYYSHLLWDVLMFQAWRERWSDA